MTDFAYYAEHIRRSVMPTFCEWWHDEQARACREKDPEFRKQIREKMQTMIAAIEDVSEEEFTPREAGFPRHSVFLGTHC